MTVHELIARWQKVRTRLLSTIETFSAQELDNVAMPGGYSVVQLILHIAHDEEGEISYGLMRKLSEWPTSVRLHSINQLRISYAS